LEELYCDVPPTKLRSKDEKFRPARTSWFWLRVADIFFYNMLEGRFCAFRYKGVENYLNRDDKFPTIFFAPHNNWWDGIVGYNICNRICKKEIRLMIEELNRFPLLRRGGGFSVNKKSPQASMESLQYSVRTLKDLNNILYIFPQGIITPPNHRPIELQTGISYIAQKAAKEYGKVNLVPVAVNYFFLRDNRPEVWVEFGEVIELSDAKINRKEYSLFLAKKLETLCDKQIKEISNAEFKGYETLFQQKLAWYRAFEQRLKRIKIGIKQKKDV
ncbi:MAG: lysophospholipid acyltransferase family protein, partial [Candidatus Gastranaerophilales bacterium]|nr:lysophospholipid acyltransferase family protein [Candidatus Gastranaerophilales bacterium]